MTGIPPCTARCEIDRESAKIFTNVGAAVDWCGYATFLDKQCRISIIAG
jgi:hypothetical protein